MALVSMSFGLQAESAALSNIEVYALTPVSATPVLPDTVPPTAQQSRFLRISASRGEYEPVSFALRATDRAVDNVYVNVGDLLHSNGQSVIGSENIDVRVVKPWFQSFYAWREIGKSSPDDFRQTMVPELLLKDQSLVSVDESQERNLVRVGSRYEWVNQKMLARSDRVDFTFDQFPVRDAETLRPFPLLAHRTVQLWATVHVPNTAVSGNYDGEIQIKTNEALLLTIKLQVRVHAFELVHPKIVYSIYYRGQLNPARAGISSEFKSIEQLRNELIDLVSHGISVPTVYQLPDDPSALEEALRIRQETHANAGPLFYLGIQTTDSSLGAEPETILRSVVPTLLSKAKRYGFSSLYIYGRDEAVGSELLKQRDLWRIVHKHGAGVFVAGYSGAFSLVGDVLDIQVQARKPDPAEAARWHSSNAKVFSYDNPQTGPENPYLFRLNYGLMTWANDYDGVMPYAYQHCFGSCWSDLDHPVYRDHNLTYPTVNAVIGTIAWEGLREAIDDARYVATLEEAIEKAPKSEAVDVHQAREFLSTMKQTLRETQARAGKYNADAGVNLDSLRQEVVEHIERIHAD